MSRCIAERRLCMGQHDDKRFRVNVVDGNGDPVDISAASEIAFAISRRVTTAALLTKTLTGGGIHIGVNTQFYFDISSAESGALPAGRLHCEAQITNSGGEKQTVLSGPFIVQDTLIGD